ncbi:MAG: hypothetical protein NTV93_03865 [Verrucomicrobia bacterium]|nr:hypothetical protein [Verrucomicrobiota bacterium]
MNSGSYRPHKNLPPLAGLSSFEEAMRPGLPVDECVSRLKRFHYSLWRLHQISLSHIAEEPVYELKMAFSLHGHLAAENDSAFRSRIGEMREPPLGLEKIPHPAVAAFFDEILATPSTEERLLGLYEKAWPALRDALRTYIGQTHVLADECWSRVLSAWKHWKEAGLTAHRNWWPDLYSAWCRESGQTPDPDVLAFHVSYEDKRADLKEIAS